MHQTEAVVVRKLEAIKSYGIETMCGGPVLEIARLQGRRTKSSDSISENLASKVSRYKRVDANTDGD